MHLGSFYPAPFPPIGGSSGKVNCLQCRRPGFNPWVPEIPWRRKWQPTPVGYSPWGCKASDTTERQTRDLPQQSRPVPMPESITSSSCAPDSSSSGTTDCTGRGPLGEKAPRGRDTSRGQSSSGGSPIRLWGTGEFWSGRPFPAHISRGKASCYQGLSRKRTRNAKFFPLQVTYSKILPNWSASEFPQKRGLR